MERMEQHIFIENVGVFGYQKGILEKFESNIDILMSINDVKRTDDNTVKFKNKVQAIINYMNDEKLRELLQGGNKAEKKTIKTAYSMARKKLLKQEIKNDLEQRIAQSLEQGSNLEELTFKMQSDMALIEMYGEMSDEDKKYISKCVADILKPMKGKANSKVDNDKEIDNKEGKPNRAGSKGKNSNKGKKKNIVLTAMKEVESETLNNALRANEATMDKDENSYLAEVAEFTNGYKFLCEDSSVYAAKTGYRRKFKDFGNYEKFYKLRKKLKEVIDGLAISESNAISLVLEGVSEKANGYITGLEQTSSEQIKVLVENLSKEVQEDEDNKYILEQVRSKINLKPIQDNKNSSGEGR